MGDRVSISFKSGGEESVALFSQYGGAGLVEDAKAYAEELKARKVSADGKNPLDRLEPRVVMIDFIRHLTKDMPEVGGDFYLGRDDTDGDNDDNGHYVIDLSGSAVTTTQRNPAARQFLKGCFGWFLRR